MECFEVDTKIISYLEHALDDHELQEFLEHLNECEDCRNEVELYFTLIEGLNQMDEDEIQVFDFRTEFQKQRKERLKEVILRKRYRSLADHFVLIFVIVIVLLGFLYGFFQRYDYEKRYIAQEVCYEQQISID
ncbi:MAG: zf-HC2 domain-containing protein [Lachnospiraceae bacterium]|nr:zf-HC2 domain-containing protein [Lachnospiraceae bacterium]